MSFVKAVKDNLLLRMALFGPSGSGKTYSALNIAQHFGSIALIDSEHGSAKKYADLFTFDVHELDSFHPELYIQAIHEAEEAGYDILIIDSLSHEWSGKDGALEQVDREAKKNKGGNKFAAWSKVTPMHRRVIDTFLGANLHVIATMRSKTAYEVTSKDGKMKDVQKVGLAPIQRDEVEYEFDITGMMDMDNNLIVDKTRCPAMKGEIYPEPGEEVANTLKEWLQGQEVSEEDRKKFHAIGKEMYGDEWDDWRHYLAGRITKGRTKSSTDLRKSEIGRLIARMEELRPLHVMGREAYGDEWPGKREKLIQWVSDGRAENSFDLRDGEVKRLLEGIEEKREETVENMITGN